MTEVALVTTRVPDAQELWTHQFITKVTLQALTAVLCRDSQVMDDIGEELRTERSVDGAVGVELDLVGALIGQPREGRVDDVYRLWIKARIRVNKSSGNPEQIYQIALLILASADLFLRQFPVGHVLENDLFDTGDPFQIQEILQEASATGVPFIYAFTPEEADGGFLFRLSDAAVIPASNNGFGSGRLRGWVGPGMSPVPYIDGPLLEDIETVGLAAGTLTSLLGASGAVYVTASDPANITADVRRNYIPSVITDGGNTPPLDAAAPDALAAGFTDSPFTVLWYGAQKGTGSPARYVYSGFDDAFSDFMVVGVDTSNRLTLEIGDPASSIWDSGSFTVTDTDDHMWAVSYDGAGEVTFYLDGVRVASDTQSHKTVNLTQLAAIGQDGGFRQWGDIARLTILPRELSRVDALAAFHFFERRYTDTYG